MRKTTIASRVDQLATFGFGGRPSTAAESFDVPDLASEFPSLAVRQLDVFWGIDSMAVVVIADGRRDTIDRAHGRVMGSTRFVLVGDRWLAALYQGGLADTAGMDALAAAVSWIMSPEEACQVAERACPYGSQVGFPPPPPRLVVNGQTSAEDLPFEITEIPSASSIDADAGTVTWIENGEALTMWGDPPDPAATESRGPASVATSVGSFAFLVEPASSGREQAIVLRQCCTDRNRATWPLPADWTVDGLALVGNHRQDDYHLVVTATVGGREPVAVSVPVQESLFESGRSAGPPVDVVSLARLNPTGFRWSLPQRNGSGGLLVVEQRPDGWFLINDALGARSDLLRSSHLIEDYAADPGRQNLALITDGPGGPSMWWVHEEPTQIRRSATSLGWSGTHASWLSD